MTDKLTFLKLVWRVLFLFGCVFSAHADTPVLRSADAVPVRVLAGFDGLRFGASQAQVTSDLRRRDALQFETTRVVAGTEVRYRTMIGDLPFDVFLQFDPTDGWRRALVSLAAHTFGQTAQRCAALHERVLYLVSLEYGPPDWRTGPGGRLPPVNFVQRAEFVFKNDATVTVHSRFDAETCYNQVVYDASIRRPAPSLF